MLGSLRADHPNVRVVSVERVVNAKLAAQFKQCQANQGTTATTGWHGTGGDAISSIVKEGLSNRYRKRGSGIYVSSSASTAAGYSVQKQTAGGGLKLLRVQALVTTGGEVWSFPTDASLLVTHVVTVSLQ